jgi:hypothetical protein
MANKWNQQTIGQPLAPTTGDAVPHRSNRLTKMMALFLLRLTGWRIVGEVQNVLIYPPFTPTGQIDKDMQQLKSYYQGAVGKHAANF